MQARHRLRSARALRRVMREGSAVACREFVLYYARGTEDRPRVAFVVGRRVGGAVIRNRSRRRLREAFRPLIPRLAEPVDIVIVAREPVREAQVGELRAALEEIAARARLIGQT